MLQMTDPERIDASIQWSLFKSHVVPPLPFLGSLHQNRAFQQFVLQGESSQLLADPSKYTQSGA